MTVKEVQELIETWTAKNKIRNNELTNMALLTEEIGKLSRVMVHRFNDRADEPHFRYEVSDEIGDILDDPGSVRDEQTSGSDQNQPSNDKGTIYDDVHDILDDPRNHN